MEGKLHKRVLTYNLVSLFALVVLIGGMLLNFLAFTGRGFIFLILIFNNNDNTTIILFWPILVSIAIIVFNKKSMNKFINSELNIHLQANNINVDYLKDTGSTGVNKEYFPKFRNGSFIENFDMNKSGEFDDLGFTYKIDDYTSSASYRYGNENHKVFTLTGQVYNFFYDKVISENLIIIGSKSFEREGNYKGTALLSSMFIPKLEEMTILEYPYAKAFVEDMEDESKVKTIDFSNEAYKTPFYMVINKNHVSLFSMLDKFVIKVPLIITKGKLVSLKDQQKGNAYKYNTFLYDLAFSVKDLVNK